MYHENEHILHFSRAALATARRRTTKAKALTTSLSTKLHPVGLKHVFFKIFQPKKNAERTRRRKRRTPWWSGSSLQKCRRRGDGDGALQQQQRRRRRESKGRKGFGRAAAFLFNPSSQVPRPGPEPRPQINGVSTEVRTLWSNYSRCSKKVQCVYMFTYTYHHFILFFIVEIFSSILFHCWICSN